MRNLGILALTVNLQPIFEKVIERSREQVLDMQMWRRISTTMPHTTASSNVVLALGGLIAVVLGIGIAYWIVNFFSKNLIHIAEVSQLAASGNYKVRAKIESKDELGQLAASFNAMLDYITTALEKAESERDELQKRLMGFLVLVSDVGKGDLTKRGEVTADMFGNLADGFNLMIGQFGQLLQQVRVSAESVNKSGWALRQSAGQMAVPRSTSENRQDVERGRTVSLFHAQVSETAGASSESAKQCCRRRSGPLAVHATVQTCRARPRATDVQAGQGARRPVVRNFASCRRFETSPIRPTCSR